MLEVRHIRHSYDGHLVLAIDHWSVGPGEHWLLLGHSGSGKSTLIHLLAGLLSPSAGEIQVNGQDLGQMGAASLDRFRGRHIGLVFQKLHLLPNLTVMGNLLLAQHLAGFPCRRDAARALLAELGIEDKADAYPKALSHGQAQRVSLARAVINRPSVILADEPTSSLDDAHTVQALALLQAQARRCGAALVIATHDSRIKQRLPLRLELAGPAAA